MIDDTGRACVTILWSLTDTVIPGGKEVANEQERSYPLSAGVTRSVPTIKRSRLLRQTAARL